MPVQVALDFAILLNRKVLLVLLQQRLQLRVHARMPVYLRRFYRTHVQQ